MGLAAAGVAEQHDRLAGVDPRPGGQRGEGGRDAGDRVGVKVGEPLDPRELRFSDPAAAGAVIDLRGEDLGQVGQMGLPFPDGDLGEPGGVGADGGQLELAGGRADRRQGSGVGDAAHRMLRDSSWS
jgi:hypothetical protein